MKRRDKQSRMLAILDRAEAQAERGDLSDAPARRLLAQVVRRCVRQAMSNPSAFPGMAIMERFHVLLEEIRRSERDPLLRQAI